MATAKKKARRGAITAESSRVMIAHRNELAAQGKIKLGRPPSVLTKAEIAKITSVEAFRDELTRRLGEVSDDLLRNSKGGDTQASKILVEQAAGKPKESKTLDIHVFDIYQLAKHAQTLPIDGNGDIVKIESPNIVEISEED